MSKGLIINSKKERLARIAYALSCIERECGKGSRTQVQLVKQMQELTGLIGEIVIEVETFKAPHTRTLPPPLSTRIPPNDGYRH